MSKVRSLRKLALAGIAAGALGLTACASSGPASDGTESESECDALALVPASDGTESESVALDQLTIVVPTSAGGGVDTAARQLQPYLEESLGATVVVENHEGGATTIGTMQMLNNGDDCSSVLITGVPHINLSYIVNDVEFDLSSFAAIGGISVEPGVIRVANDAPWASFAELIEDARERPGEISFSVSEPVSANVLGLREIEAAAGVDFNIVPFDGGGPSRLAVESGEVDATHAGVFNSLPIAESTRVLSVQHDENRWAEETDDAPTVAEVIGADVAPSEATYNLWASAACAEGSADVYDALVSALEQAVTSDELRAELEPLGEQNKLDYREPERVLADAEEQEAAILQLLEEDPSLLTES